MKDVVASRRAFLRESSGLVAGMTSAAVLLARPLGAQETQPPATTTGGEEMSAGAYIPVSRPPKPNATPSMTAKQIDDFERQLACPCPCTLDVYMCRTTMFSCGISPAVHGDVQRLVAGGYSADEIMTAMMDTYGDFILNAPRKQGFNLLAWFAPFVALAVGAVAIGALLRGWRMNAVKAAASSKPQSPKAAEPGMGIDATPEELDRLQAALREER
ncbi:MAG TPA: cytochrome c-type biogenesis protein CcmH [Gemmatimonas sp.]|uniref:cytochrome c-type biogenesis protein CcmH n=1 Tax=Gemmatimonas sp. TaxID=1962908 RepID=UPI002ED88105